MQKTPNQKGFTKKVKRVCSFKAFNAAKREKRKEKYTLGNADGKGKTKMEKLTKIEFLIWLQLESIKTLIILCAVWPYSACSWMCSVCVRVSGHIQHMEPMSTNIQYIDHETIEMERDEAEEKCLVQQQVIMDQMKQLKKVTRAFDIITHFSLIKKHSSTPT